MHLTELGSNEHPKTSKLVREISSGLSHQKKQAKILHELNFSTSQQHVQLGEALGVCRNYFNNLCMKQNLDLLVAAAPRNPMMRTPCCIVLDHWSKLGMPHLIYFLTRHVYFIHVFVRSSIHEQRSRHWCLALLSLCQTQETQLNTLSHLSLANSHPCTMVWHQQLQQHMVYAA